MTIEVYLILEEELALREKARAEGLDLPTYATNMLKRDARQPARTFERISADIEARRGGPLDMPEEEISEMLEKAKHERRSERRVRDVP